MTWRWPSTAETCSHRQTNTTRSLDSCVLTDPPTLICIKIQRGWWTWRCILVFMWSTHFSCPILMKLEFSRQISEKFSNTIFHENPSSGSRVVPCGRTDRRTDMTKLVVAFRNFAKVPKNPTFFNFGRGKETLSSNSLGPTQPFNKCVPKNLPPGVKRPVREVAKLKNEWSSTSTPLHPFMECTRSKITVQY